MKFTAQGKRLIVRGAGEMATGVIRRLHLAGFQVLALEQANPECIRRTVCFAEAVYEKEKKEKKEIEVEGVTAVLIDRLDQAQNVISTNKVPVLIDPLASSSKPFRPDILVDARMLKEATDSSFKLAPCVIGLGPGFTAGIDCWALVETNRGFDLGRVIYQGSAEPNTGLPGKIGSIGAERVLRSPSDGKFVAQAQITDLLAAGQIVGSVNDQPVIATIDGCLRGLIRSGSLVLKGQKVGDIDPRGEKEFCHMISDKANAIAGGVLEAALLFSAGRK